MSIDLRGKTIVITGASSGIGRATALECAHAGMAVVLGARREDRLHAVVDEIRRSGGRAEAVACDVTSADGCARLVARADEAFGGTYAVFANAGYGFEGPVDRSNDAELRAIFETNLWGSLNVIRPALASMRRAGRGGHVIWCSSCLSKMAIPYLGPYSATKAAQDHLARAMRHELAGEGIFVSSVHPVGTATEFSEALSARSGKARHSAPPASFTQRPETVAQAVVRCLRRPRGEVWTSAPARLAFAFMTAFPGIADGMLGWRVRKMGRGT